MGRRRNRGRNINGVLLLDKPQGMTSNKALQEVKFLYKAAKAGHTGSLDPLATGLLPICFGEATKLSAFLLDADKRYLVKVKLGETTTTADAEGDVVETSDPSGVTEDALRETMAEFLGEQQQLPPMYSAIKHNGERLYKLARQGIEVEREPRTIHIHGIDLLSFDLPEFEMDVRCSKGTYVRTLAEDIGKRLGCGAYVSGLRRTGVGPYDDQSMLTLEQVQEAFGEKRFAEMDEWMLPLESALADWPEVALSADAAFYMKQGQPILVPNAPTSGWVRLYANKTDFIGVGQILDDGRVAPKRLMQAVD
ncbi:MAG: tRNA pseudouridine(55) synthase TruB [Candidatus Thiodiazotropha lotti]|uniref:tRNA pseudouridine synthase B n=1 Tax=Candidatus Thiodiazotropha lotti TaxID=2792787 RepID=A0A9E4K823_9GAMM|nr:tRNA pseudouridine(55) synthase TruB [Candidatus Thiodiazotropha lotti]ODB99761.1 tRNA pseudouridine(55) synthase TruB [Candidatus Thiodiazotropha endoloripes]MCG7921418.1 tRNA pseudouridine(55) synthase TruB [Candidatus Thiodiazotropha lotti]MCG7941367.1 tRNA pseudouridine(55) synthase TruB [Candidatus Thiodiazotropha lotti]MCG8002247.1 tRNA pseudouridine(55) synthase TruB [Candidatus Thiodiazotropha lotti]